MDREWSTGFYKQAVPGSVFVGRTNLEGDGQADLRVHGGPDKAINVYASEHYPYWRDALEIAEMGPGGFGENLTLEGILEGEAYIGDIYQVGEVRVQISQPRQPCWKLGRRWRVKDLPAQVIANGKTGWYFRVLEEGKIEPGLELELLERTQSEWSITAANQVLYEGRKDQVATRALSECASLSQSWKQTLSSRLGD